MRKLVSAAMAAAVVTAWTVTGVTGIGFGTGSAMAGEPSAGIMAAIDNPGRSDKDRARDATRKPGQVLEFAGIAPGATVLDIFSGGGYYAEILSHYLGSEGKVIAQNNQAYLDFVKDELATRYADGRLANVDQVLQEANDLDVGEGVADAALLVLSYHDIYHHPKDGGWPDIDRDTFLGNIYRALKPGGMLLVIDHRAAAGSPTEVGESLHRIDPARVTMGMTKNGFVLELEANFLSNPDDPLDIPMYDETIRGKTDRFVHRYRKPL